MQNFPVLTFRDPAISGKSNFKEIKPYKNRDGVVSPGQVAAFNTALCKNPPYNKDLIFMTGPAGSRKTFSCIAPALYQVLDRSPDNPYKRLILARPKVAAGEDPGTFPGGPDEKIAPYLSPLIEAVDKCIGPRNRKHMQESGQLQIMTLELLRGVNIEDAIVVLDEAQNTTEPQIWMFISRLCEAGRMYINGDFLQVDLKPGVRSGLKWFLKEIVPYDAQNGAEIAKDMLHIELQAADIARHRVVYSISKAIDGYKHAYKHVQP